jgi:hypothetical protein
MAIRIMTYVGLLYQDLIASDEEVKKQGSLPPVLPVVIYTGDGLWTAHRDAAGLISKIPPGLEPYILGRSYFLLEAGKVSYEHLKKLDFMSLFFRLERPSDQEMLEETLDALKTELQNGEHSSLIQAFMALIEHIYLPKMNKLGIKWLKNAPIKRKLDMFQDNLPDLFYKIENEGLAKGLAKGRAEGLAEGLAEGGLKILKRQLSIKFGSESTRADVIDRLRNAGPGQIELWCSRILQARTIDEVFKGD